MSADGRLTYLITFDRIGRHHQVAPLELTVDDGPGIAVGDQIAQGVYRYAKPKIASSELEVDIRLGSDQEPRPYTSADFDGAVGTLIVGGFRLAGSFDVKAVSA